MYDDYYVLILFGTPIIGGIIAISVLLFFIFRSNKGEEKTPEIKSEIEKRMPVHNYEEIKYMDGISAYDEGLKVVLSLLDDKMEIKPKKKEFPVANIQYTQIKKINIVKETEIKEFDKSVTGRAVVGGLLLGGLGAVIGGMSGLGKKTFSVNRTFLVINYISSSTNELQAISFEETSSTVFLEGFLRDLNKFCGIEKTKPSTEPINL